MNITISANISFTCQSNYHHPPQHHNTTILEAAGTLQLPEHHTRLLDSNFLIRMLYKESY